jgi:cytochrome c oxidase cbb3-type subunit 2
MRKGSEKNVGLMAVLIASRGPSVACGNRKADVPGRGDQATRRRGVPHQRCNTGRDLRRARRVPGNCHSQMVRGTLRFGTLRAFRWLANVHHRSTGSKRTGPEFPVRSAVPTAPRAHDQPSDVAGIQHAQLPAGWQQHLPDKGGRNGAQRALQTLGDPYTDAEIKAAPEELAGKTELDAIAPHCTHAQRDIETWFRDHHHPLAVAVHRRLPGWNWRTADFEEAAYAGRTKGEHAVTPSS